MSEQLRPSGDPFKDNGWWWWKEPEHSEFGSLWECVAVGGDKFIRAGMVEAWPLTTPGTWGGRVAGPPPADGSKPVSVWVHEGKGHYIGSVVIVHATNQPEAEAMIRKQLDASGLQAEPLKVTEIVLRGFCSIYFDNGDY